jgi:AcrR family transcriptional regulator
VSPRKANPKTRETLVDVAAHRLVTEGPGSVSIRRIAADAGTSTMAIYTHFGGMNGLVREVVQEGFERLQKALTSVSTTDDPVADLAGLGRAYRANALANPDLYPAMFGGSSLAALELTEEDRQHGRYTLVTVVECAQRCIDAGRFRAADAGMVAHQMWFGVHGLVALELGSYLIPPWDAPNCLETLLINLMVGAGDDLAAATRSVAASAR